MTSASYTYRPVHSDTTSRPPASPPSAQKQQSELQLMLWEAQRQRAAVQPLLRLPGPRPVSLSGGWEGAKGRPSCCRRPLLHCFPPRADPSKCVFFSSHQQFNDIIPAGDSQRRPAAAWRYRDPTVPAHSRGRPWLEAGTKQHTSSV